MKAVEVAPGIPQPRYLLARVDWHCDRIFEALQHVVEYRAQAPEDPKGLLLHGSILGVLGDRSGDKQAYRLALKLFTEASKYGELDAIRLIGVTTGRLGQWSRSLASARHLVRLEPDRGRESAEQVVHQALQFMDYSDLVQLRHATDEASLILGPDSVKGPRVVLDALEGRVEDVLSACETSFDAVGEADPQVRLLVATALIAQGNPKDAYPILKLEDYPDEPPALVMIAQSAIAAGQPDSAVAALRALSSCSGIAGTVAHTALDVVRVVENHERYEALGIVAKAFAERHARALYQAAAGGAPGDSAWEGEHPQASPVVERIGPDLSFLGSRSPLQA
jgi:hypothetical protein